MGEGPFKLISEIAFLGQTRAHDAVILIWTDRRTIFYLTLMNMRVSFLSPGSMKQVFCVTWDFSKRSSSLICVLNPVHVQKDQGI